MSQDDMGSPRGSAGAAPKRRAHMHMYIRKSMPQNSGVTAQKACEQICVPFVLGRVFVLSAVRARVSGRSPGLTPPSVCRV